MAHLRRSSRLMSSLNVNNNPTTTTIHQVNFSGETIETTVTSDAVKITEWVNQVLSLNEGRKVISGLDVEWKPNRSRYVNHKAATLQLCVGNKCLIIQLFYLIHIPKSLKDFMSRNPNVTFVGVEVAGDVEKLTREYGLTCANVEDVREVAMRSGGRLAGLSSPRKPGLKDLAWRIVGLVMTKPKNVTMSNWEVRVLSEEQVEYACIDAYASYRIGYELLVQQA